MRKKYIVRLTAEERTELHGLVNKGKAAAYKRLHAQILLKADVSQPGDGWEDSRIQEAFETSLRTVERTRQRWVEQGLEAAINRAQQNKTRKRALDGEQEAYLIALSCSEPPAGRARWTMQLLADRLVELKYVESVSDETVRKTLKKRHQTLAKKGMVYTA